MINEQFASVGKGSNSVTSMLHHHFENHGYGEKRVTLHMDNCSGQNKNNTVIGYGMWRVMCGLHEEIVFSTMEVGHTKFSPVWHFGLWKVRWKHCNAESMGDIVKTVEESSRNGHNIPQTVDDPDKPVIFFDWASFTKKFFKTLPKIKKYHHFRMTSTSPGIVYARNYAHDVEEEIRKKVHMSDLPDKLPIAGLDAARQWYLFQEIAPLCHDSDFACPLPEVAKPAKRMKVDKST